MWSNDRFSIISTTRCLIFERLPATQRNLIGAHPPGKRVQASCGFAPAVSSLAHRENLTQAGSRHTQSRMDKKEFVMATKERQRLRRASRGRGEAGEEQDRHEGDEEGFGDEVS